MRVSPSPFGYVRFGIVNPHGSSCVSISRSPMQFSHRHFGFRNPYSTSCMSTVGSPRPFAHRQFGFYNPHAVGGGRLAPLSYDSLVANSCSPINFSSRAFSRWLHIDPTLSHFWVSSVVLSPPQKLRFGMCPRPTKAPIPMISTHFGSLLELKTGMRGYPRFPSPIKPVSKWLHRPSVGNSTILLYLYFKVH